MLKNLQSSVNKHHIAVTQEHDDQTKGVKDITRDTTSRYSNREVGDTDTACNIVHHIFSSIDVCLKEDKSKVKLSGFTKSFIRSILTGGVKSGIDDFIRNMNDKEIRALLNDIQSELDKRK